MTKFFTKLIIYLLVVAGAVVMLMPFAWMVSTSFKTRSEVERWPPQWGSKSFLKSWKVKVKVSSGAIGGLDWRGLSLREALTLQDIHREENILSIVITDDPVYRGTMTLNFARDLSYLSGNLDRSSFEKFITELSFVTKVKEVKGLIQENLSAEEFFTSFFALYTQGLNALLDRRNYIGMLESSLNNSINQVQTFERYSGRIPQQHISEYLEYLQNSKKSFNDLLSKVSVFRKGTIPILQREEIEQILILIRSSLEQVSTENLSDDLANHPVLKLYRSRAVEPIEECVNVLETYEFVSDYFSSIQREKPSLYSVVFTFPTVKERRELLINAILSQDNPRIDFDVVKSLADESLDGLPERYEKILDEKLFSDFSYLKLEDLRKYIQQIKIHLASVRNSLEHFPDLSSIDDFQYFKEIVLKQTENNEIVLTALERLELLKGHLSWQDFRKLLTQVCENIDKVSRIRRIHSRILSVMRIHSAPDFVKEVRMKQNQNIELVLDNIHPVYLEDETYVLTVDFTWREVLANVFHNYVTAWKSAPFGKYYLNTVFVSVVTTVLEVILSAMAAYAFAYMNFPGKNLLFGAFLATMMVPGEVLLVPNFITITRLGWIDTYYALIVPWIVSVFAIFLMRQHFLTLPMELKDAAMIDGCSHWRFLWTIVVPLSKPVIITSALLKFVGSWNAFLWVLIVTNKDKYRTLTVGLQTFSTDVGTVYNQLMAAATLSIIPIVILFIFTQRYFVRGIARTGLK